MCTAESNQSRSVIPNRVIIMTTDGLASSLAGEAIRNRLRDQIQYGRTTSDFEWSMSENFRHYANFTSDEIKSLYYNQVRQEEEKPDGVH